MWPLMADIAKECGATGEQLKIIEVLKKNNPCMEDGPWQEASGGTTHEFLMDSNLPLGTWREINKGVPVESGGTEKVTESIGMLCSYFEADLAMVRKQANPAMYMTGKESQHIRGMSNSIATCFFYGNPHSAFTMEGASVAPNSKKFYGLAPRYNATSGNANVVLGEAGSGDEDMTSIYVVQWGLDRVSMVYPRGSTPGLKRVDKGNVTLTDADGNQFEGRRVYFEWEGGLAIGDTRCVKRLANIDADWTATTFGTAGKGEDQLLGLLNDLPDGGEGAVIYCNSFVKTLMDIRATSNGKGYTYGEPNLAWGKGPVTYFHGFPVRVCQSILRSVSGGTTGEHVVS